jgi:glycosyltransferase involved in cell wall biosynthesis
MKILLIANGYPPHRWAGTETYTAGIANGLQARGHQVRILCVGEWENGASYWNGYDDDIYNGVPVRRIHLNWMKSPDPFGYLYNNPEVASYLESDLKNNPPDLVHVTSCETLSASILKVIKDANLALVLSLTDFWFLCPQINLLRSNGQNCDAKTTAWECLRCMMFHSKAYRWPNLVLPEKGVADLLMRVSKYPLLTRQPGLRGMAGDMAERKIFLRQSLRLADCRITASSFVRNVFIANGVKAPIMVRPYGHDLSWLNNYSGKSSSKVIRFGFIGQIVSSKGIHILLKATQSIFKNHKKAFKVVIYGDLHKDADYSAKLQAISENMDNVQFLGTYLHENSAEIFANIDVLVVPSLWYDFPLVIYEAFATKTPVIATNLGGMAEAVQHGSNGLLFVRGDVPDLARQLKRIVNEPELLEQLRSGIPAVKSIDEEIEELEQLYCQLLHNQIEQNQEGVTNL